MQHTTRDTCLQRLGRIEGQVRGITKMVAEDRYCVDVITQITAVRAALRRVEEEILRDHTAHCVEDVIASGDPAAQRRKVQELVGLLTRASR